MRKHLKSYRLDDEFVTEVLSEFFHVGEHLVYRAINSDLKADISFRYLHLDKAWIDHLVKEMLTKKNKAKAKTKTGANQLALL